MKIILLLSITFSIVGCSTFTTKDVPLAIPNGAGGAEVINTPSADVNGMWGYPYSGTRMNLMWWNCLRNYITADEETVDKNLAGNILAGLTTPFLLVDTVLSFAADTILLPADLIVTPEEEYHISPKCFGYGDTWGRKEEENE